MAEGEGFEPPLPVKVKRFSRPPVSTAHTSLRVIKLTCFIIVRRVPIWFRVPWLHIESHSSCISTRMGNSTREIAGNFIMRAQRSLGNQSVRQPKLVADSNKAPA